MSFALDVKNEIIKNEIDSICCARAELVGMVCFGATINNDVIRIRTEHGIVAQRFYDLIKHIYNLKLDVVLSESGIFTADMKGNEVIKILRDMKISTVPIRIDKEIVRNECCKMALIRGAFLGGGSISDPAKSYHAEIATSHFALCKDFYKILNFYEIYPKKINRNGNYVFYLKDSDQIENLLAVLGAYNKMMEFLNVKIEKDVRNTTNRLVNCETANVEKTISAAVAQKNAIEIIKNKIGIESLSPELKDVAILRTENPDASLSELAEMLGITKSGVNHRMRKLISIAKDEA